jgi:hypothetical protein
MENYIVRNGSVEWKPLKEQGIDTTGLFVKSLRFDEQQKRSPSILLKGSCIINETALNEGDFLYTPPGFKHSVRTVTGCEMLLVIPTEVEVMTK